MSDPLAIIDDAHAIDVRSIRELAISARIDAWSEAHYLEEVVRTDSFLLKAMDTDHIVGFLLARIVPGAAGGNDADLYNIAVDIRLRRKGIASMLLCELISRLKVLQIVDLWLEVRESNISAIEFYKKHGFEAEITRSNFYANPVENAVIMRLRMGPRIDVSKGKTMLDSYFEQE